tara:strand:+ start:2623 stop:3096 length:474 start_codon:yes stop_codon:yes gene_type:complete
MQEYIYIFIILLIYTSLYFIFTDEFSIYQTDIDHFNFDLLYSKQPIVINNLNLELKNVLYKWFSYNIIKNNIILFDDWGRNKYKYLLISSKDSVEVTLCNPKTSTTNGIPNESNDISTIKLNNKSLIIPFKWYYHISSNNVEIYGIHDYITYMLEFF